MSRVETTIEVQAPVDRCFAMWACLDCITCVLRNVEDTYIEDNIPYWHWVAHTSSGMLTWDTAIDSLKENEFISWHSAQNAPADVSGSVQFESLDNGGRTRLHVEMMFGPPVNQDSQIYEFFDKEIENRILEDMGAFRQAMEEDADKPVPQHYALSNQISPEAVFMEKQPPGTPKTHIQ